MRQLYFRRTSSSNVGQFEDANDERCHLWTLLHNGDEFFGFATAIREKLYECVVHLESDKRVSRTMHFKTHFFSPAILSPSFASQKIHRMNPSNVSWIPILSNYFSRYLPRCNISNASYNLHYGNGRETRRCVGMIESLVLERSFFVRRLAASFLLQVIGISRTKDIYVYDCWLPGGPWNDASALHSKDPVGRPYRVSVYHPYICLPPSTGFFTVFDRKRGTLKENLHTQRDWSSGPVKSRGSLVSDFEKFCTGGPIFVLWQKLFKDIKLRDLSSWQEILSFLSLK